MIHISSSRVGCHVFVQVNDSLWQLGDALCDTWVALDVGCCTASILNLTAISVDRFNIISSVHFVLNNIMFL